MTDRRTTPDDQRAWPFVPAVPTRTGTRASASDSRRRALGIAGVTVTAAVALGLGASAVVVYENGVASPAAALPVAGTGTHSGAYGTTGIASVTVLGPVLAVSRSAVTVGAPGRAVSAVVTSATRFTGTVHQLGRVRVGATVSVQILLSGNVARLVILQDPASPL